jgi:L-iditol 2-dehydrogenase
VRYRQGCRQEREREIEGGNTMRAARLIGPGKLVVRDEPMPRPEQDEVLVRSKRASICGSDLHIVFDGFYRGTYPGPPGFPGHEGVGQVEDDPRADLAPGTWVLAVPNPPVARCYAEVQAVPRASLLRLPDDGNPDRLLLAQQLGTVVFAFRRHWPAGLSAEGRSAAICGAGSAGLFFVQLCRRAGFAKIIVADRSAHRLAIAKGFGADLLVLAPAEDFVAAVLEATNGAGADLVIEAAGYDATRIQCLEAVRRDGRVGYFGFPEQPSGHAPWSYSAAWQKTPSIEITNGTQLEPGLRSFKEAIALIHSGEIDVEPFLEDVYPLEEIQAAFEAAYEQRGSKIAVEISPR